MPTTTPPPVRSIKRTSKAPQATFQAPAPPARRRTAKPVTQEALIERDEEPAVVDEPDEEPASEEPANEESARPTEHNGISIVREETRESPVAPGYPLKVTRLHLSDGTVAYGCLDCTQTCDTRAELHQHRNEAHGTRYGKRQPKITFPRVKDDFADLVLPPRPDGSPAPTDFALLTMGEIMSLAPSFAALFDYISKVEDRNEQLMEMMRDQKDQMRQNAHAIAVYPGLQAEVVELRMRVKDVGAFDEMKAELLKLRAWKRNMIKRLESMGFNLADEEQ